MGSDEVTLRVLMDIRDGIRGTNERIDGTNTRMDDLAGRMDKVELAVAKLELGIDELRRAHVASEVRTATAIHELADTLRSVHTLLKDRLDLRDRVERCEHDIEELKRKIS